MSASIEKVETGLSSAERTGLVSKSWTRSLFSARPAPACRPSRRSAPAQAAPPSCSMPPTPGAPGRCAKRSRPSAAARPSGRVSDVGFGGDRLRLDGHLAGSGGLRRLVGRQQIRGHVAATLVLLQRLGRLLAASRAPSTRSCPRATGRAIGRLPSPPKLNGESFIM